VADDVAAAAFERAWRSLTDVHLREIEFRPWIFRIAVNELIDIQRATSRRLLREERHGRAVVASTTESDPGSVDDLAADRIPVEELRAALSSLSEGHQTVITLRWFADFEPTEIAAALGISKGAVAVRTHRAMAALRSALGVDTAADGAEGATR